MKKLLVVGLGLALAAALGYALFSGNNVEYVAAIDDEVSNLEVELETLNEQVVSGTLTPTEAAAAQAKIVARLNAITSSANTADQVNLSPKQRAQLVAGLNRLQQILSDYRSTLVIVDATAEELSLAERTTIARKHGVSHVTSVSVSAETALDALEEQVEEVLAEAGEEPAELIDENGDMSDEVGDNPVSEEGEGSEDDVIIDAEVDVTTDEVEVDGEVEVTEGGEESPTMEAPEPNSPDVTETEVEITE